MTSTGTGSTGGPSRPGVEVTRGTGTRIAVLYATRQGQARRVAERVADTLRKGGTTVDVENVVYAPTDISLLRYAAVVIVASVHMAHHEREMIDFVIAHRQELNDVHTAFLSVSLSEAGAEMVGAAPELRAKGEADASSMIESFCADTGWRPERIQPVAGALRYSQYGFVVRFVMRSIAKRMGGSHDSKRDVEYTDWAALDHFVEDIAVTFAAPTSITARSVAADSRA